MKIDCKHVWQHISAYIDGDVDAQLRAEIDRHLEHCEICSAVMDSTRDPPRISRCSSNQVTPPFRGFVRDWPPLRCWPWPGRCPAWGTRLSRRN